MRFIAAVAFSTMGGLFFDVLSIDHDVPWYVLVMVTFCAAFFAAELLKRA